MITYETRTESYEKVDKTLRYSQILECLDGKEMTAKEIATNLGMDSDEVLRLKQISGLKEAFIDKEFSKSWEEFEHKHFDENGEYIEDNE